MGDEVSLLRRSRKRPSASSPSAKFLVGQRPCKLCRSLLRGKTALCIWDRKVIKVELVSIRYQSDIILRIQENVFQGKIISFSLLKINVFWQIIHLVQGPTNLFCRRPDGDRASPLSHGCDWKCFELVFFLIARYLHESNGIFWRQEQCLNMKLVCVSYTFSLYGLLAVLCPNLNSFVHETLVHTLELPTCGTKPILRKFSI